MNGMISWIWETMPPDSKEYLGYAVIGVVLIICWKMINRVPITTRWVGSLLRNGMGIGLGIACAGITLNFFTRFNTLFLQYELTTARTLGAGTGLMLYFKLIFEHITLEVDPGKAVITGNALKSEKADQLNNFRGTRVIRAQREYQAGTHFVFFWEKPAFTIDMVRQIIIDSDDFQFYTMENGTRLIQLKWKIIIVPLVGNLVNFVQSSEEAIRFTVKTKVEEFLQGYMGDAKTIKFGREFQQDLEKEFEKLYGGQFIIDPDERQDGYWTRNVNVYAISEPKEVQDARMFMIKWGMYEQMAKDLVTQSGERITFQDALRVVLISSGALKSEILTIEGLFQKPTKT